MSLDKQQAYQLAMAAAQAEFDELFPQFQKLNSRMVYLKQTMRGLSGLLDVELEEKYSFHQPRPIWHGPSRPTNVRHVKPNK